MALAPGIFASSPRRRLCKIAPESAERGFIHGRCGGDPGEEPESNGLDGGTHRRRSQKPTRLHLWLLRHSGDQGALGGRAGLVSLDLVELHHPRRLRRDGRCRLGLWGVGLVEGGLEPAGFGRAPSSRIHRLGRTCGRCLIAVVFVGGGSLGKIIRLVLLPVTRCRP